MPDFSAWMNWRDTEHLETWLDDANPASEVAFIVGHRGDIDHLRNTSPGDGAHGGQDAGFFAPLLALVGQAGCLAPHLKHGRPVSDGPQLKGRGVGGKEYLQNTCKCGLRFLRRRKSSFFKGFRDFRRE